MIRWLAVLGCLLLPSEANAALLCTFTKRFVCMPDECKAVPDPTSVWAVIDLDRRVYTWCDTNGCDSYDLVATRPGIFINLHFSPGTFVKMSEDYTSFVEAVTILTTTIIGYGSCTAGR